MQTFYSQEIPAQLQYGYPKRIVCLTVESTETLYLLGEQARICGISGFTVRPPEARREKPRVSAYTSAKIDRILDLKPDLAIGFSDLQADIARELIRSGVEVHIFNHYTVTGIFSMIRTIGALVNANDKANVLIERLDTELAEIKAATAKAPDRPRIYFEEWNDPLISGITWVSELIHIAGGEDCFSDLASSYLAKNRIIADKSDVVRRAPDIIIGSWCGKRFHPDTVAARPGWNAIPAVREGHVYEIKSCDILQPGPAALTDGVRQLHEIVKTWREQSAV